MGEGYESSDAMRMLIWANTCRKFVQKTLPAVVAFGCVGGDGGRRAEHQSQGGGSSGSRWAEIAASTSFAKSESNTLPEAIRLSGALFLPLD